MVGALSYVVDDPRVEFILISPVKPLLRVCFKLNVEHSVDKRRRHGFNDSAVLRAVACSDNNASLWQVVFAYALFMDKAVKCFLYLL